MSDAAPRTCDKAVQKTVAKRKSGRQRSVYGVRLGGAGRDRTDDLSSAIAALSQLSYGPRIVAPFRDRPSNLSRRPKAIVA